MVKIPKRAIAIVAATVVTQACLCGTVYTCSSWRRVVSGAVLVVLIAVVWGWSLQRVGGRRRDTVVLLCGLVLPWIPPLKLALHDVAAFGLVAIPLAVFLGPLVLWSWRRSGVGLSWRASLVGALVALGVGVVIIPRATVPAWTQAVASVQQGAIADGCGEVEITQLVRVIDASPADAQDPLGQNPCGREAIRAAKEERPPWWMPTRAIDSFLRWLGQLEFIAG